MSENNIKINKKGTSRAISLFLLIPALLFALISIALSVQGPGLIPIITSLIAILSSLAWYYFFKKSFRYFTFVIVGLSIISAIYSLFQGVLIEKKVAMDESFKSSVIKAQNGIDDDLDKAYKEVEFESGQKSDSVMVISKEINGEQLYISKCAICHMQNGMGIIDTYPPLAGSDYLKNTNKVIEAVLFGLSEKIVVNGKEYHMPEPASELSDEEATTVINYIFTTWGNSLNSVTLEQVKAVRMKMEK